MNDNIMTDNLKPKMAIEYEFEDGILTSGSFDNIPQNAFRARIGASFPIVGANGELRVAGTSYDLYVGQIFDLSNLEGTKISHKDATNFRMKAITKFVLTKFGLRPLNSFDAVFATQEEMAEAITKIKESFESLSFYVKNAKATGMHK